VLHTAGPFQHSKNYNVIEAALEAKVPYIDVCDDTHYSEGWVATQACMRSLLCSFLQSCTGDHRFHKCPAAAQQVFTSLRQPPWVKVVKASARASVCAYSCLHYVGSVMVAAAARLAASQQQYRSTVDASPNLNDARWAHTMCIGLCLIVQSLHVPCPT
jgi:hypothetical protein